MKRRLLSVVYFVSVGILGMNYCEIALAQLDDTKDGAHRPKPTEAAGQPTRKGISVQDLNVSAAATELRDGGLGQGSTSIPQTPNRVADPPPMRAADIAVDTQSSSTPSDRLPGAGAQQPSQESTTAEDAQAASTQTGGLETVVVTARRTAENIQRVPVAVTAFTAKDLEREQINTAQDLNGRVPSLVINPSSQGRNVESPTIRGQGATHSASPGVIIYYGEVPIPADSFSSAQGGPGKFFDLENLQVLKGPQGTLFGRNTTGGALLLEPHKPDPYFEASIKGELGNFEGKGVEGVLNLPVVEDQLMVRVGAKYYEREGFTKDIVNGANLDGKGYRTMRLGLMWKPVEGLQNYVLSYYTHSADSGTSQVIEQINRNVSIGTINAGCAAVALGSQGSYLSNYSLCGRDVIAAQQARGVRAVALSTAPDDILDTGGVIDQFSYQIDSDLTVRDIASYQLYKHHNRGDDDGSILVLNEFNGPDSANATDSEAYTEELQLQGRALSETLKYVGGIYYQYQQPAGEERGVSTQFGVINTINNYSLTTSTYGPYAQATYNLGGLFDAVDGLNLTAGARESFDRASGTTQLGSYLNSSITPLFGGSHFETSIKNSAPTWTIGLDYKLPTTMLYGKVSRGYKSGGISPEAVSPSRYTYKPEFVTTYELGHKTDLMLGEIPLRINSALYYTNYKDIQKIGEDNNGVAFGAAVVNAAEASIAGFETELSMQPIERLTLLINYSYGYAKYDQFTLTLNATTPQVDCTGQQIRNGQTVQLQCMPFDYVPKHQGNLTARYQLPIAESLGTMTGNVNFSFVDRQYTSSITVPQAEPGAWLGSYGLLNASLDWSAVYGSAFDVQLFGTNLTDRTYRTYNSGAWNFLYFQSSVYGEPRMYGIQLAYHWRN